MEIKIGKTLSKLLKQNGTTLKELSDAVSVPRSTLQEWKTNRMPKNPIQAQKVASYFGVTLHYMLFGEEDPSEPLQKILKEDFFKGTFEINIKRIKIVEEE